MMIKGGRKMTDSFRALPEEKKERVFAAAIQVFAARDYKHASTDDIAAKAGVTKGILFYWFRNKRELYLDCMAYLSDATRRAFEQVRFEDVTDFFELMELGGRVKTELACRAPHYTEFAMRAYFSEEEWIARAAYDLTGQTQTEECFRNIDWSKFREGVDGKHVLQMLVWMMTGYLQEKQRGDAPLDFEEAMEEYRRWAGIFRRYAYKEEYQ